MCSEEILRMVQLIDLNSTMTSTIRMIFRAKVPCPNKSSDLDKALRAAILSKNKLIDKNHLNNQIMKYEKLS